MNETLEKYRPDVEKIRTQSVRRSWSGDAILELWDALRVSAADRDALRERLDDVVGIGYDYDGMVTADDLRQTIKKMVRVARGEASLPPEEKP